MSCSNRTTILIPLLGDSLLEWFDKEGRHDLPWRKSRDSYHVYVSEIMLQQTQVQRVAREYYPSFLARFPDLRSLAKSDLEDVLTLWSGLGYYQRARNMHKCAQICQHSLPSSYDRLLKLPGIGSYTAAAICSFAYDQPIAVVDTNIARVLSRLFALKNPAPSLLRYKAREILNLKAPREHNLALMDLGAMICTPKSPQCHHCPLSTFCKADDPLRFGQRPKQKKESLNLHLGWWQEKNRIALVRSQKRLYEGMLIFPEAKESDTPLLRYSHAYTKYIITVSLHPLQQPPKDSIMVSIDSLETHPLSSLAKKGIQKMLLL